MLKTTAKIFLIFILLVAVAVITGFTTYNLTKNAAMEKPVETVQAATTEPQASEPVGKRSSPVSTEERETLSDYYTVRLEGTTLGVYVINDGKEEFLYHADVYKNDLSAEDLVLLQNGVKLMNMSELTGFIENFTS